MTTLTRIAAFLDAQAAEAGAARNTVLAYGRDLKDFAGWLEGKGLTLDGMTRDDITAYLASAEDRPDGIFAASDVIAMSALRALAELGLAVPGEVKVIGYDGLALGEHTVPRLSTVKQDLTTGARNLVDLLLRRIAGEETGSVVMMPELVTRLST